MSGTGHTLASPGQFLNGFGYPRLDSANYANAVSPTPPTPLFPGMLWFNSNDGQLYVWYVDPNSAQWVAIQASASGSAPFQVGPGLSLNVGTTPPTIDVVTPYLPLTGGTLSGAGNLAVRGGLIVGAVGSIPAPGNITLNQNAVTPIATYAGSGFRVIGADGQVAGMVAETYGASPPILAGRNAGNTGASPANVTTNSVLLRLQGIGYAGAATYGGGATIDSYAAEPWTTTTIGSGLRFYSTPVTTNVSAVSMTVQAGVGIGSAAAPAGNGTLVLNANTVQPPAGVGIAGVYVAGADNGNPGLFIDAFGGAGNGGFIQTRHSRGTAAAPTGVQSGDLLSSYSMYGRNSIGTYPQSAAINCNTTEIWSGTANGSQLIFYTTPTGTNSAVASLSLNGNTATFSGNLNSQQHTIGPAASGIDCPLVLNGTGTAGGHNWILTTKGVSPIGEFWIYDSTAAAIRIQITTAGACNNLTGTWGVVSDTRAKENIQPYSAGLDAVLALDPITYDLVTDDWQGEGLVGFAAEQVAEVLPHLSGKTTTKIGGEDVELLTAHPTGVVFALVNAIKELKAEIDDLKRQLGA